jgi:ABC-type microcin C transport system permease subunit YejB
MVCFVFNKLGWEVIVSFDDIGRLGWEVIVSFDDIGRLGWEVIVSFDNIGRLGWEVIVRPHLMFHFWIISKFDQSNLQCDSFKIKTLQDKMKEELL